VLPLVPDELPPDEPLLLDAPPAPTPLPPGLPSGSSDEQAPNGAVSVKRTIGTANFN
jgi:hypothetical protein